MSVRKSKKSHLGQSHKCNKCFSRAPSMADAVCEYNRKTKIFVCTFTNKCDKYTLRHKVNAEGTI